jgi:hypothetical protein
LDSATQAKLKFFENKVGQLEAENDKLQHSVQNLEGELEEVQDNFKEDEADEYRNLKRDLETQSKNVRVLQFKLKKSERSISELAAEKTDLEAKIKTSGGSGGGGGSGFDSSNKLRNLEKELEQKTVLITKYEQQIADLRGSKLKGIIDYRFLATETNSKALYIFRCLFTTSSVKLFVVTVQIFVYNFLFKIVFFGKKKKTLMKPFTF